MTAVLTSRIEIDDLGVAWIADTRTKVAEVVLDKLAYGWSPEEIHSQHSDVSLARIHAALAWYYENQASVDAFIQREMTEADQLAREASDPEFRRRLLEFRRANPVPSA